MIKNQMTLGELIDRIEKLIQNKYIGLDSKVYFDFKEYYPWEFELYRANPRELNLISCSEWGEAPKVSKFLKVCKSTLGSRKENKYVYPVEVKEYFPIWISEVGMSGDTYLKSLRVKKIYDDKLLILCTAFDFTSLK